MKDKISINTQSSIRLDLDAIFYFDPFQIKEEKHDADYIFITHDHYDHFDIPSILNIKKEGTKLIYPKSISLQGLEDAFTKENLVPVEPMKTYNIGSYTFDTISSYNLNKPFHPKEKNYVGYLLKYQEETILVTGDTDLTEEVKNISCTVAFVPIGGFYTMDYKEASALVNTLHPKLVIPTHYGSIVGTYQDGEKFKKVLDPSITCVLKIKEQ